MASRTRRSGSVAPAVRGDGDKISNLSENGSLRSGGGSSNAPQPSLGVPTGGLSGSGQTGVPTSSSSLSGSSGGGAGAPPLSTSPGLSGSSAESKLPSMSDVELLKELNQVWGILQWLFFLSGDLRCVSISSRSFQFLFYFYFYFYFYFFLYFHVILYYYYYFFFVFVFFLV
jgi:hypothetical protein